jgi:hypothetical protein
MIMVSAKSKKELKRRVRDKVGQGYAIAGPILSKRYRVQRGRRRTAYRQFMKKKEC